MKTIKLINSAESVWSSTLHNNNGTELGKLFTSMASSGYNNPAITPVNTISLLEMGFMLSDIDGKDLAVISTEENFVEVSVKEYQNEIRYFGYQGEFPSTIKIANALIA